MLLDLVNLENVTFNTFLMSSSLYWFSPISVLTSDYQDIKAKLLLPGDKFLRLKKIEIKDNFYDDDKSSPFLTMNVVGCLFNI